MAAIPRDASAQGGPETSVGGAGDAGAARPPRRWPDIILVNGASSAGKTTLCRALQASISHPYLCMAFDDFIFFSAPRYYRGADSEAQTETDEFILQGARLLTTSAPGEPKSVTAVFGPVFRHLVDAIAPAVRTMVDMGNPVIFDHVLHDRGMFESCQKSFDDLEVFTVGVVCPIDILEARERARGDRAIGRARGLVDVVHSFCSYDIVVDTGHTQVDACVAEILARLTPA
jgi:chloramphenicol 3-O phosphotransferase